VFSAVFYYNIRRVDIILLGYIPITEDLHGNFEGRTEEQTIMRPLRRVIRHLRISIQQSPLYIYIYIIYAMRIYNT